MNQKYYQKFSVNVEFCVRELVRHFFANDIQILTSLFTIILQTDQFNTCLIFHNFKFLLVTNYFFHQTKAPLISTFNVANRCISPKEKF